MEFLKAPSFLILVISSLTLCSTTTATNSMHSSSKQNKGAYWPSWAVNFPPSTIDTTLFTHVYYAFLESNNITFKLVVDDPTALLLKDFTTTLHNKNPNLKTLYSIGGASGIATEIFSRMASSHKSRKTFIESTLEVARKFNFDGVDLDWEFPSTPKDMKNFRHLIHEWRVAVKKEAKATGGHELLLSAATYFSSDFFLDPVYRKYPVASINKNLDWINAMCYDYRGSWDVSATGSPASLYDPKSNVSTSYGLQSWIKAKIQREKLVMGLPLYGRTWQLKDPSVYGIGAPAVAAGPGEGHLPYVDVEKFNAQNSAKVVFDLSTVSTYSVAGTSWIGYDDVRSTSLKVAYARGLELGGYFFWSVDGDQDWKISREALRTWAL